MSIKVKQHDISDCGAACIASVAGYYKLNLPIARIRQLSCTGKNGTSVAGLLEGLHALGFEAKGGKGDISALINVQKPAIVHLITQARIQHFVVVYGATPTNIEVMDPADGRIHNLDHTAFLQQWTGVMVITIPGDNFSTGTKNYPVWRRLWRLVHLHRDVMLQALAGSLIFTIIGLSTSVFVQKIVDHVLPDGNRNLLNLLGTIMVGLLIMQVFIAVVKGKLVLRTGQRIDAHLILGYYGHLLRLPQAFFDGMRTGEIISRVNDAMKIRAFVNDAAVNVAVNIFIVVFSFALMFTHQWKLAVAMMTALPGYLALYFIADRVNRRVERSLMENAADLESQLVESIQSVQTIKSFCMERFSDRKTESRFVRLLQSIYSSGNNTIVLGQASEFVSKLFTIAVLWIGAGFVLDQTITPGELLSFYALFEYFSGPASSLIEMNKTVQNALIAADRLFDIMDLEPERQDGKALLSEDMMGDITFAGVHFRYDASMIVFKSLDLVIKRNCVTAIVGESGCGKSTIVSILQRLYPVQGGVVKIGSCDLRYFDLQSLRKIVAVVPQRIDMFAGTILENIALGDPEPDLTRVISICEALNLLPFIERLPDGLYSWISEQGASLSGGQKQRIAIARAMYLQPEILLLDEATSALDANAEQFVQDAIELMRKRRKTVVMIAHRLSSVTRADHIVVLGDGQVIEQGTHEKLLARKEMYFRLWNQQYPPVHADVPTIR